MRKSYVWFLLFLLLPACTKKVKLDVPKAHLAAQTASNQELFELINERYAGIQNLTIARSRIEFTSEFEEEGYLKVYPGARAHLVARPPDAIYLSILNPITSSTVVTMASENNRFQIWVPRENKFLVGENEVRIEDENPMYHVRPNHVLQAILIEPLPDVNDSRLLVVEEDADASQQYYTVLVAASVPGQVAGCLQRKLWIERSALQLSRQVYYDCGRPTSRISYGPALEVGTKLVSSRVDLDRVEDHYRLRFDLQADAVRLDRQLRQGTFSITQPAGAELVEVKGEAVGVPDHRGNTGETASHV